MKGESILIACFQFLGRDGAEVHLAPEVGNVSHHERDDQRNDGHSRQGEFAGGAIGKGERTLQVSRRGVIRRAVVTCEEEECHHHQHRTRATEPNASLVTFHYDGA